MKYADRPIKFYLKDLGAKTPAPGGGSAAALASCMAANLLSMAVHFTLGKEKYKEFQPRAKKILAKSSKLQKRALELVDEDVDACQKKDFGKTIRVPAEICFLSYEAAKLGEEVIDQGNRNLMTDAVLAVFLSEASLTACLFYVEVNLKFLKQRTEKYADLVNQLKALLKEVKQIRKKAEAKVGDSLRR